MFIKFISFLVVFMCFGSSQCTAPENINDKINLTLYYESLCPGSQEFFTNQLYPAWREVHDGFNLILVPYGAALHKKVDGKWEFMCQHGPEECYGNKIQACVINNNDLNEDKKMAVLNCLMSDYNSHTALPECASTLKIDATPIETCANSTEGDNLLAMYGDQTKSLNPILDFIPKVYINGIYNQLIQRVARGNLKGLICRLAVNKPKKCVDTEESED